MSESLGNSNPNVSTEIDPSDLHLKNVPEALQLDQLEELAKMGDAFRARDDFSGMGETEKDDKKLLQIDEFLEGHGLRRVTSDPIDREAYEYASSVASDVYDQGVVGMYGTQEGKDKSNLELIVDDVKAHYNPEEQFSPELPVDADEKLSVRQRLTDMGDRLRSMLDRGDEEPSADDLDRVADELKEAARQKRTEEEAYRATDEELDYEEGRLGESSEKFVKMTAERTRHLFEGLRTRSQISAAKEEASDALSAIATSMYLELSDAGLPDEEITRQIDDFIANQSDEMANQMEAEYKAEYDNASPVMKALYDKWSLWGEQGTKGKLKKAALLAPGLVAIGAVGGVAGGAVIGAAAGAGIALLGKSVGRQLLRNKLDRASNVDEHAAERIGDFKADAEVNSAIFDALDTSSEKYRKRNRNRMMGGVAISMATGAVVGGAAGFVGDMVRDHVDFDELRNNIFDGSDVQPDVPDDSPAPDPTDSGSPDGGQGGGDTEPAEIPRGRGSLFDGYLGTRELTPEGQQELLKELNNYRVESGDTIWDISEKMLEEKGVKNPSVYEIDATKDFLLKELQSQGYADSRGWLNAGDTIKLR